MRFVFVNADEIAGILILETGTEDACDISGRQIVLDRIDKPVKVDADP
jgi:hypothetical protein